MIRIKRQMSVFDEEKNDKQQPHSECQASFNSDGVITLRNYNSMNKNQDEIIVLSRNETTAILKLLSKIGTDIHNHSLPF